jgi:hypothetical protein
MMTPLPWGSRPVGNLVFLRGRTSERGLGRPLIPTPRKISWYLLVRTYHSPLA